MAIVLSLSKKGNHIKVTETTPVKKGVITVNLVKNGFIELDADDAAKAKADRDAFITAMQADAQFFSLGSAFTTVSQIDGEDVATGKLYEVIVS